MKRRITVVVPDGHRMTEAGYLEMLRRETGVTVERVEDIPDPDRVQEFRVRIVTKVGELPWTGDGVSGLFVSFTKTPPTAVTVTEVDPTEVPS